MKKDTTPSEIFSKGLGDYNLSAHEEKLGAVEIEDLEGRRTDRKLRKTMAWVLVGLFVFVNLAVMGFIGVGMYVDNQLIISGKESVGRIINDKVIMALIAGTVVELGAMMYAITNYLFPKT